MYTDYGGGATGADGSALRVRGKGELSFVFWGRLFKNIPMRVMSGLTSPFLMGLKFLRAYRFTISVASRWGSFVVGSRRYSGKFKDRDKTKYKNRVRPTTRTAQQVLKVIEDADVDEEIQHMKFGGFSPELADQEEMRRIIWNHRQIFKGLGNINVGVHKIQLKEDAVPYVAPARRLSRSEQETEKAMVHKLVEAGILEPAVSQSAARNVFVPKKDSGLRCTGDFRGVNIHTVPDRYPAEDPRVHLEWLASKAIYTSVDLKDGYYQIKLDPASRPWTAVRTCGGLFQYTRLAQGHPMIGHFGVRRTRLRIRERFGWSGLNKDVTAVVKSCLLCNVMNATRPKRQGRFGKYQVSRRWELVAMDVLEISPASKRGNRKVLVIGDTFMRFCVAVPLKNELAETVARAVLNYWVLSFGPPEKLLSDRGKTFVGKVIKNMCEAIGTKKISTSPYHPQTDGMIERMNRTICKDIRSRVAFDDSDWCEHVALACYRYNTSVHSATGMTPFRAMFGSEAFDFDAGIALRAGNDERTVEDLATSLRDTHDALYKASKRSRDGAEKAYNRAVREQRFDVNERVLVYNPIDDIQKGRKLRTPWLGPYRVKEVLSPIAYLLESEVEHRIARVHVNRLTRISGDARETMDPREGVFPDTRRLIRKILDRRGGETGAEYKVKSVGRRGYVWTSGQDLPPVVTNAYELMRKANTNQDD